MLHRRYHRARQHSEMCVLFVKAWVLKDVKQTSGCAKAALATCTEGQALVDVSFTAAFIQSVRS